MDFLFRGYVAADRARCLSLFDVNCPDYFAANERDHYCAFIEGEPDDYLVIEADAAIVGAFGLEVTGSSARLHWIMIDPACQGRGIGRAVMAEIMARGMKLGCAAIDIAASHLSAPFFTRFGAQEVGFTKDGWGAGMHRVDMLLPLESDLKP
jgi:GNAT superfamily N-acetyltransferase